jgi:hypothetical protein
VLAEANRRLTVDWWDTGRSRYKLVTAQFTVDECGRGEAGMAVARLAALAEVSLLPVAPDEGRLATALVRALGLPAGAAPDANHLAAATVHAAEYLLTWHCKHLANASLRTRIERACAGAGYRAPIICTPSQLMENLR